MQSRFGVLLQVQWLHEYYRDSQGDLAASRLFEVKPTASCQQQLKDYGLLLKANECGFTLLYRTPDSAQPQLSLLQNIDTLNFRFYLYAAEPSFFYFSDLPIDASSGTCYYLSNQIDNQQSLDGSNRLLISRDNAGAFLSADDQFTVRPPLFPYSFELNADVVWLSIRDANGDVVMAKQLEKLEDATGDSPNPFQIYLDLTSLEAGLYSLFIGDQETEQFYLESEQNSISPFAIIDIYADISVPLAYRFTDEMGVVTPKTYQLRIDCRETIWKYLIALKYNTGIADSDLQVVSNQFSATFTRQSSYLMADDTKVIPFESSPTLIPLLREPLKGFSLQRTLPGPGPGSTEETPLPAPSVTNLAHANGKIYSEVYVYI